jgi:hypothetical protein
VSPLPSYVLDMVEMSHGLRSSGSTFVYIYHFISIDLESSCSDNSHTLQSLQYVLFLIKGATYKTYIFYSILGSCSWLIVFCQFTKPIKRPYLLINILYFTLVKVKYSLFMCVLLNKVTVGSVGSSARSSARSSA